MLKYINGAIQADADTVNIVEPPLIGTHVGDGIHVDIPDDWQAQITAGKYVPGCTFSWMMVGAYLPVSDHVQNTVPPAAVIPGVPPAQLASFKTKLSNATPTAGSPVAVP